MQSRRFSRNHADALLWCEIVAAESCSSAVGLDSHGFRVTRSLAGRLDINTDWEDIRPHLRRLRWSPNLDVEWRRAWFVAR